MIKKQARFTIPERGLIHALNTESFLPVRSNFGAAINLKYTFKEKTLFCYPLFFVLHPWFTCPTSMIKEQPRRPFWDRRFCYGWDRANEERQLRDRVTGRLKYPRLKDVWGLKVFSFPPKYADRVIFFRLWLPHYSKQQILEAERTHIPNLVKATREGYYEMWQDARKVDDNFSRCHLSKTRKQKICFVNNIKREYIVSLDSYYPDYSPQKLKQHLKFLMWRSDLDYIWNLARDPAKLPISSHSSISQYKANLLAILGKGGCDYYNFDEDFLVPYNSVSKLDLIVGRLSLPYFEKRVNNFSLADYWRAGITYMELYDITNKRGGSLKENGEFEVHR